MSDDASQRARLYNYEFILDCYEQALSPSFFNRRRFEIHLRKYHISCKHKHVPFVRVGFSLQSSTVEAAPSMLQALQMLKYVRK